MGEGRKGGTETVFETRWRLSLAKTGESSERASERESEGESKRGGGAEGEEDQVIK